MGRAKGEASHHVHDPDVKLNEDKMDINSGSIYFTAKAAANHRRARTSILILEKTFVARMSSVLDGVEHRDVTGRS
jgi:hypothetical protein